ncbi:hypothetical protein B0T16DRAFT_461149 [Cercophora newfieldiana]|uniref:Alpha/beta-hydrolase n=1 Tax=Cercophora newfieldiana TaxID=92897 RepID=A0AA39XVI5_9PEZI|nr:hypothetical protein B0T16DRAFT_461149 [Cercophora newfieldiana]
MRKWLPPPKQWRATPPSPHWSRPFSALRSDVQHIQVPCASAGDIPITLHNTASHSPTTPLILWIPPFSFRDGPGGYDPASLLPPRWLQGFPTATLNYRWAGLFADSDSDAGPRWPTPLHDVVFGWQWVLNNLAPPDLGRRDVYVYGSYLGASLAASLALTEAHGHAPMGVRGLVAYNGVYNWTAMLRDHPINKGREMEGMDEGGSPFHLLKRRAPLLFREPANLFDPFASPTLFFHTSGLLVPPDFESEADTSAYGTSEFTAAVDALSLGQQQQQPKGETPLEKATRKAYLTFPPRKSSLRIPDALLLYDPPPASSYVSTKGRKREGKPARRKYARVKGDTNSFESQARHFAKVMVRSVEMLELKDRMKWDSTYEDPDARIEEAERRVKLFQVGEDAEDGAERGLGVLDLNGDGERVAGAWLRGRAEGGGDVEGV